MRDKNFDVDLLKTLNGQPMPETPLTDDEFYPRAGRCLRAAAAEKPAGHRRFPWDGAAAACRRALPWGWAASTLPPLPWPSSCP